MILGSTIEGDDRPYKGWKEGGHGNVDMKKAIVESSDVYFYALAYDLTINNLSPFLEKFGYGKQSGLTENEAKEFYHQGNGSWDISVKHGLRETLSTWELGKVTLRQLLYK